MSNEHNLYPLHVFRVVARLGGVTRAAEKLSVSQPAVSAHLRALEGRLGARLFERTPRGVLLTDEGRVVLERADRLFDLHEGIAAAVDEALGRVRGEVVVAASSTPGAYLLPALLRTFRDRHPEARPALAVGDTAEVLARLHDFSAPLGVVGEAPAGPEVERIHVAGDELRLVARADDPVRGLKRVEAKHLSDHTLLLREPGSSTRAGAEELLGDLLPAFGHVVEIRSAEAIKQAVVAGLGVAVLSSWSTRLEEKAGLLWPVRDKRLRLERRFYAVRRSDRQSGGAAAALWLHLTSPPKRG